MAPRTTTDIRNINSASPIKTGKYSQNSTASGQARTLVDQVQHIFVIRGRDLAQEDDEDAFIEPLFQTALHIVQSSLPRSGQIQPTYNDKLLLYSLFKQAVHGDVKTSRASKRPGVFDMLGRAKWDAWKAREGLSCSEAKRLYIESVLKILHSHRDRPEARTLIESLSGSDRMGSEREGASRSTESRHKIDEQLYAQEEDDIQSARLGLYKSSSQLPDPISSSEGRRILPPHSPKANDTPSRSSSNPPSQSLSTKDHSNDSFDQTSQTLPSHSLRSPIKDLVHSLTATDTAEDLARLRTDHTMLLIIRLLSRQTMPFYFLVSLNSIKLSILFKS
ncbi:hypothetical protein H4Q26_012750 [Puccinia striiformis f. sp. tritici PST-130]|nr:hypothetical protein H4Q26_012750 [Puccinia striiformis f. sp. tritici PST-130]